MARVVKACLYLSGRVVLDVSPHVLTSNNIHLATLLLLLLLVLVLVLVLIVVVVVLLLLLLLLPLPLRLKCSKGPATLG